MARQKRNLEEIISLKQDLIDYQKTIDFLREVYTENIIKQIKLKIELSESISLKIKDTNGEIIYTYYLEEFLNFLNANINIREKIFILEQKIKLTKLSLYFFYQKNYLDKKR